MSHMIGPLTAAGWAQFRLQNTDGEALPSCCATVSDFRDAIFELFSREGEVYDRDGKVMPSMVTGFRAAYWDMVGHGLPDDRFDLIGRLARHYLGDPPREPNEIDRMHHDEVMVRLCGNSGQPTVTTRPSRFSVSALPETHPEYRHLVIHVELVIDRDLGERWRVRWGSYIWALADGFDTFDDGEWEIEASCPDGVDRDKWWIHRSFPVSIATQIAHRQAVKVDVNGHTAADIARRVESRLDRAPENGS